MIHFLNGLAQAAPSGGVGGMLNGMAVPLLLMFGEGAAATKQAERKAAEPVATQQTAL